MGNSFIGGLHEFEVELALGNIPYREVYRKWGRNNDIDSTTAWIWANGGNYTWQTTADTLNIVSTSGDDTDGGSGWDTCTIYGYDANYDRIEEAVTLSGITPVSTVQNFIHVYRVNAGSGDSVVGSGGINAGDITITFDGTSDTSAFIEAGDGGTMMLFDIVPRGYSLLITHMDLASYKTSGGTPPQLDIRSYSQKIGKGITLSREDLIDTAVQNDLQFKFNPPYILTEKTRWWITCTTTQANTRVSGTILGMLIKTS